MFWTCVKDHIIDEKEDHKDIRLRGFDYKLFEEQEGGGTRKGLYSYPYLKHIVQLCPDDWVIQMAKMNEAVDMKNRVTINGEGKRLVRPFKSHVLWKCIGCTLSVVTYGKKLHKLWSEIQKPFSKMENTKQERGFFVNTDLYKVYCAHYFHFYTYACHLIILSYTTLFISWMFL